MVFTVYIILPKNDQFFFIMTENDLYVVKHIAKVMNTYPDNGGTL